MLALFSLTEVPLVRSVSFDPDVLVNVSGADRIGGLRSVNVREVDVLHDLRPAQAEAVMEAVGAMLKGSLARRVCLWLAAVDSVDLPRLQELFGEALVVAGPLCPVPEQWRLRLPDAVELVPIAVNPSTLMRLKLAGTDVEQAWARRHLEGLDSARLSGADLRVLRDGGVDLLERSGLYRTLHSPVFWAYTVVMAYSLCRALPVLWVPHFHGNIWVLWGIDVVTAVPYTWGVVTLVAGRTWRWRLTGLIVTLVTLMAPYVYFWSHGRGYPPIVDAIIGVLIAGAVLLEVGRWLRDRRVAAAVRAAR
ncbi:hypothetical protein M3C74_10740 [Micrococcus lylae]|uniref:hypothetical protein n=1 Tax=Micrococcus lylae TaxID=1273 RepID=UPI0021A46540|nr:hypothetical protein [Micrococcus lylae]MCT2008091.1 hypothetical protein [Micrococcus lylae]MCT2072293.1 hypothetical protein [Micrococcus lylae]